MFLFCRLLLSLLVSVIMLTAAVGQTNLVNAGSFIRPSALAEPLHLNRSFGEESDSLLAKRSFFSTAIFQQGSRLDRRLVRSLLASFPQAFTHYRQGQWLKPAGPVLIATGLVMSYLGVRGTSKTAYARGIGTKSNPSPPDVLVEYTDRSLPTLLGGVGLVVGGLCLIEVANGQLTKSVLLYNAKAVSQKSITDIREVRFGLTSSGNIGLVLTL